MPEFPLHDSPFFDVREWVDQRTWGALGPRAAWQIDPRIVRIADAVRELTGRGVMVNNWHYAKGMQQVYKSSGLRAKWDSTGGALSQHRRGCAADLKVTGMTPAAVLAAIQANKTRFLDLGLTAIENLSFTPTWLHLDCRPVLSGVHPEGDFLFVNP